MATETPAVPKTYLQNCLQGAAAFTYPSLQLHYDVQRSRSKGHCVAMSAMVHKLSKPNKGISKKIIAVATVTFDPECCTYRHIQLIAL